MCSITSISTTEDFIVFFHRCAALVTGFADHMWNSQPIQLFELFNGHSKYFGHLEHKIVILPNEIFCYDLFLEQAGKTQ